MINLFLFPEFDFCTIIKKEDKRGEKMPRGGKREGAGRKQGSGKFGEPTRAIRIPESEVDHVLKLTENRFYKIPLYLSAVAAGFPSPAESSIEGEFDLNELLIKHPAATFFVRASGSSMINAGIHDDDILVVDKSIEPSSGKVVVVALNGELTVKRLFKEGKRVFLMAENEAYPPIELHEGSELHIWGVVTNVIHAV
jgi:DNA polymerase V